MATSSFVSMIYGIVKSRWVSIWGTTPIPTPITPLYCLSSNLADQGTLTVEMSRAVFLSYARKSSAAEAQALHAALGADLAFLDTEDLEARDEFPRELAIAVLDARVVVIFADSPYFESWYCRAEMRLALAPFYCGLPLRHILVARAPGTDSSQLPPVLSTEQLLAHTATDQLADLVRKTLIENPVSISEKIPKGAATFLKEALISNASMPRPQKLARACFPNSQPFPASLDDRFLGRANDLFNIDQALANVGTGAATIAGQVSAAGGFGKTRLAIEYARRYANRRFPGGVFWLDASQNNLEEQFHVMWREIDANASELKIMREESRPVGPELARGRA